MFLKEIARNRPLVILNQTIIQDVRWLTNGSWFKDMTQDEKWLSRYNEVRDYIEQNHRNPSKHRVEEHDMLNWLKANRKALNAGKMKTERIEKFRKLLEMTEQYRRKNQYE